MALKFKKPFGPGTGKGNIAKRRARDIRDSLGKKGLRLNRLPSGAFGVQKITKKPTVSTPRRTSRGVSF